MKPLFYRHFLDWLYYLTFIFMYRTLAHAKFSRGLSYCCISLNDIISDINCSFFDIVFQRNNPSKPISTFYVGLPGVMLGKTIILHISPELVALHYHSPLEWFRMLQFFSFVILSYSLIPIIFFSSISNCNCFLAIKFNFSNRSF